MKSIPLYLHIPFCRSKCSYCNFYSIPLKDEKTENDFTDQLISQIIHQMKLTGSRSLKTVYIGGGTPSGLSHSALRRLLDFLRTKTNNGTEEFTMECNPEDVTEELIALLKDSPVDRLSLGIQSFNEIVLQESGRRTTVESIDTALDILRREWSGRLNIDIITGLPGQSAIGQISDMEKAVQSGADHISCYSLIIEENSPISNNPLLPDSEEEENQWSLSREYLIDKGFNHYEVSNFAKTDSESLHNLQYWKMNEYLGCGPGAVAMFRNGSIQRYSNPPDLKLWLEGESSDWNASVEEISPGEFLFENFMMGLRTAKGIDKTEFIKRFSITPEEIIKDTIRSLPPGSFRFHDDCISLSDDMRLFMNPVLLKIREEIDKAGFDFPVSWP
ncbi:radical SAM family heme chaperone HemW [Spirochaeta isovalerica]|uniref:Heme chaperone HemW n=1 Tax=Spirochaeta isovalerica TaxID=150 RepID=A0A841R4W0_9SPIO|nr:radical SAM family heme chaperone HemW [Spirochaeta isovalerica]MBB6478833.1 oxygen-independent coproporphyrinogen-3 oxidase [Spirochaeta isovalerica]